MPITPYPDDHFQTLLYKFAKNLEELVGGSLGVNPDDHMQTLLYKATVYIELYNAQV